MFHVNGPSSNEARPNDRCPSYSLINVTRECRMMSVRSRPITNECRIGQVNGADEFGAIVFVPFAPTKFGPKVVFVILGWSGTFPSTLHLIRRPVIQKTTLLLSTLKGTSSAAPKEGGPGEKTGAVGHGGPPKIAGKPETMPNKSPEKVRKPDTAVQYRCVRINWSHDWRCGESGSDFGFSVFCVSVVDFCLLLLFLFLRFFSTRTPPFCFDVSAACYRWRGGCCRCGLVHRSDHFSMADVGEA